MSPIKPKRIKIAKLASGSKGTGVTGPEILGGKSSIFPLNVPLTLIFPGRLLEVREITLLKVWELVVEAGTSVATRKSALVLSKLKTL